MPPVFRRRGRRENRVEAFFDALHQVAFLSLDDDELDARLFADGLDVAGGLGPFGTAEVGVDGEDGAGPGITLRVHGQQAEHGLAVLVLKPRYVSHRSIR